MNFFQKIFLVSQKMQKYFSQNVNNLDAINTKKGLLSNERSSIVEINSECPAKPCPRLNTQVNDLVQIITKTDFLIISGKKKDCKSTLLHNTLPDVPVEDMVFVKWLTQFVKWFKSSYLSCITQREKL